MFETFANNHRMVNDFRYLTDADEVDGLNVDYRTLIVSPSVASIDRLENTPIYSISFVIAVIDKCQHSNKYSSILSTQENLFVLGQLQDYIQQATAYDYSFGNVQLTGSTADDYNITAAITDLSVVASRLPFNREIDFE